MQSDLGIEKEQVLEKHKTIINMDMNLYKIKSLPRRIKDLEEQNYVFEREWKRDITGHRYKVYTIVSDENDS